MHKINFRLHSILNKQTHLFVSTQKQWNVSQAQGISHYTLGTMLGIRSINPATNSQRYCLESKEKRFPKPKMVKKILEVTKKEVTLDDLYKAWWKYEESK